MAGLQPRDGPAGSGADGPSGAIVTGECPPKPITFYFNESEEPEPKTIRRRGQRGKKVVKDEPEPKSTIVEVDNDTETRRQIQATRGCVVRDLSKVRTVSSGGPRPVIVPASKAVGLCNSEGDARRWDAPSSCSTSSEARREVRFEELPGDRPRGRLEKARRAIEEASPPEDRVLPKPRTEPDVLSQKRGLGLQQYSSIRPGEDDGYGEVPPIPREWEWNEPEDEECAFAINVIAGHVPLTSFGLYDF